MIYLVTGTPGTGKTSMIVDWILTNYEGLFKSECEDGSEIDRPLYFCHIDGLNRSKFKAHELTEEQIQSAPLTEIVPEGSVVIVDECDYTYPVRPSSREPLPYVKTLKELRHHGLTLILMTQHPTMIDRYLRNLVGKHIHLERKQLGTKRYEWYSCQENLNTTTLETGSGVFYTPPKQAFEYYKSSTKHIKFAKKLDKVFYAIPLLIIALLWLLYRAASGYGLIGDKEGKNEATKAAETAALSASAPYGASDAALPPIDGIKPDKEQDNPPIGTQISDYLPKIESLPETKPLYDTLRKPLNMETVAGCVSTKKTCRCYTEQATTVYVNDTLCRHWAQDGIFHVYKNMQQTTADDQNLNVVQQ